VIRTRLTRGSSRTRPEASDLRSGRVGATATSPISVVIVTYDSADAIERSLPAITAELRDGDELIVCDNGSADGTVERARELAPGARVIEIEGNPGFGVACNRGAAAASNPLLLLLNPDAVVAPGFRDAIVRPLADERGWGAWQGLMTSGGGTEVNTWGGAIHYTGIAWAGGAGRPIADAPAAPGEIPFPSGGCLLIEREVWQDLGGFSGEYFLYQEDTDLGLRLWLDGLTVGYEPSAVVEHEYEFDKGADKWFYLERNRWATIIRTYPRRLLLLLLPGLLATELALHLVALVGGWIGPKLRADVAVVRWLPRLLSERRAIQTSATATPAEFAAQLSPALDSSYLGRAASSGVLAWLLRGYWRAVTSLL
jgi:N-acetylglucosaminyl-diphospho-decaprenol L-rhamnosyltransferase